jgi:chain length determinant protein (polysaccharide antigen chain regulator)
MQANLNLYKNINLSTENVKMFRMDGPVAAPISPVAPKKGLILALSVLIGLMIAVFLVLMRHRFSTVRE